MNRTERRVKVVRVDAAWVLDWFRLAAGRYPAVLAVPQAAGLPPGFEVLAVAEDFASRTFEVLIHHPDFPEVSVGERVPQLWPCEEWVYVLLRPGEPAPDSDAPVYVTPTA